MSEPTQPRERRPTTRTLLAAGQAAGEVAHDFDNALTAIVAHATLIHVETNDDALRAHAAAILRAARAASDVVDRVRAVLDKRPRTNRVVVDLRDVVAEAAPMLAARGASRRVVVDLAVGPCPGVAGIPGELLQLVLNLGHNAVDASPPDGVVTVSLSADDGRARLSVCDRGPGIPPELRDRVFEAFFTTKGRAGTGLGLAICRTICEAHGGSLALAPAPGGGTEAVVELPLAAGATPRPRRSTSEELRDVARSVRVLLVEDDEHAREALSMLLDASGLAVTAVATAEAAIAAMLRELPDVVVTDLDLGADRGEVLIEQLSRLAPTTPVIVCSGDATAHGRLARRVGAVLPKPVAPAELIRLVRRLGAERRGLDALKRARR